MYLLGNTVITEPINLFSFTPNTIPFDGTGAVWTYTVAHQSGTPTLVSTVSGTDILVGEVTSDLAGTTTGPITNSAKVGSAVYQLTGTLSGTDSNGNPLATSPGASTSFNIHIIEFTVTVNPILYKVGKSTISEPYTITYTPNAHADIPTMTY